MLGCKAVVLGSSGFAGAELLRLLTGHPEIEVVAASASSQVGRAISGAHPNLHGYGEMRFVSPEDALLEPADIVFASLPHTQSMKLLATLQLPKVIDLGGDFRLRDPALYPAWYGEEHPYPERLSEWAYGLTEWHRPELTQADRVANPGCYPVASILALGPLLAEGIVSPDGIHIDAKSGASGAGRAGGEGFDFASANENVRPYTPTGHKHIPEIEQELSAIAGVKVMVSFVPHLVPMTRGILVTCAARAAAEADTDEVVEILRDRYRGERFVRVLDRGSLPETKRLAGTNLAEVTARADPRTGRVLAFAAIDNLGKGAAGQALQNANLMLGFDEGAGLEARGMLP
ncbi:MAG: N-acetyl-gamma-glutamyl-phosphate reductase [Candidatus Methylomirabilales bacterium]